MSNRRMQEPKLVVKEPENFAVIIVKAGFAKRSTRQLIESVIDLKYPSVGGITLGRKTSLGWMSSDECGVITKTQNVASLIKKIEIKIKRESFLCLDMSDSRYCFELSGKGWREILAKGSPVDVSDGKLKLGVLRRTRIGNLAVAFWMTDDKTVRLICMRSVSDFMREWLKTAVDPSGSISHF